MEQGQSTSPTEASDYTSSANQTALHAEHADRDIALNAETICLVDYFEGIQSQVVTVKYPLLTVNSRVLASACEYHADGKHRFIGAAHINVCSIAPHNGGVNMWIETNYNQTLNIRVDTIIIKL